jgi:hypothetical protein
MTHALIIPWAQHVENVVHVFTELLQSVADCDIRSTEFSCLLAEFDQVTQPMLTPKHIQLIRHQLHRYMHHACEVCEDSKSIPKLKKFKKQLHRLIRELQFTLSDVNHQQELVSLLQVYHDACISCMQYRAHKQFLQESVQHAVVCAHSEHVSRLISHAWVNDRISHLCG